MAAESEKLTALKKAYADIILNTAKEAAAKVLVSEKKAQRYQRELFSAKDEGLRMLLRLKQMLDAKVSEAEMASLDKQRRIDELEAQLGEAEDIVNELRAELRELQDELEKVTSNQVQHWNEQKSEGDIAAQVMAPAENRIGPPMYMISSLPAAQCDPVISLDDLQPLVVQNLGVDAATQVNSIKGNSISTSGCVTPPVPAPLLDSVMTLQMKSSTLNKECNGNMCHNQNDAHKDSCVLCNPDFASIMIRSKEPELYRNGCTQRVRAFDMSLSDINISFSGQANGQKNWVLMGEDKDKHICKMLPASADNICGAKESPDKEKVTQLDGNCIQDHTLCSFLQKRKRTTRYGKSKALFRSSMSHQYLDKNVLSGEDAGIEKLAMEEPESPITPSDATNMKMESGSSKAIESRVGFVRACTIHSTINRNELMTYEVKLTGQEAGCPKSIELPNSEAAMELANSSLASDSDGKESDASEPISSEQKSTKYIKYTFHRKRKKESVCSPEGVSLPFDNSDLKREMLDRPAASSELQKASWINESPGDSGRLEQVAHQLISLSEKERQKFSLF